MERQAITHLLSPARIGSLQLRNRIVMAAMCTNFGTPDGRVTQRTIDYYSARAAGGVGLVCVEAAFVDFDHGRVIRNQLGIDDDKFLPGLGELAGAIKRHGGAAMIQLLHTGRDSHLDVGGDTVAPSAIRPTNRRLPMPRALTVEEIRELISRFVCGAERAMLAGFDGVEVHGAHSYLLAQFLSPLCNSREDAYGGSLANRARFLMEIVAGIKRRLGSNFLLSVRVNGDEFATGGTTVEDACAIATMLRDAGVDVISVSAGGSISPQPVAIAPACYPSGFLLGLARQVRQTVGLPVIGVGRINTPALAENALREEKCDLVAFGRALIADPDLPNKVASGRCDEIRPCTACMHCFDRAALEDEPMVCSNNPAAGREREAAARMAAERKKVVVVGGGVAGMEAARVAALRGHEVTLFERSERLGGQLNAATVPPHKGDLNLLRDYYERQMARSGVQVRLGTELDAAMVSAERPEVVIVATGSRAQLPDLPGIDRGNVVLAEDVLLGKIAVGQRVVVIGGELVGCETAEYLATQGKEVTIVRRSQQLAKKVSPMVRRMLLERMRALNVVALTGVRCERIDERGLMIRLPEGDCRHLAADTIVIAAGSAACDDLAAELRKSVPVVAVVAVVGDAIEPRRFREAIHEGMAAGLAT